AAPVVDLGAAIDRYAVLAGGGFGGLAATAREQLTRALASGSIAPEGAPTGAPTLCHGDPTPGNFILGSGGDLQLIDWEYAGLCQPAFDVAGLAVGAELEPDQVDLLLATYQGRPPTSSDLLRHRTWEALCRSVGALWEAALSKTEHQPGQRFTPAN
ncbi:MAG: phosphotransferase, partial [Gammaproteobacteria bacterium]